MKKSMAAILPLILCLPGLAAADPPKGCNVTMLKGLYVFSGTGFQRPPDSPPGTPWVPKAILSVSQFNGDGTVSTPMITIANPPFVPFDSGGIFAPPAGSDGTYTLNDDCSGTIQYPSGVAHRIFVDAPRGDTVWSIQISPTGNVFQGKSERVSR